MSLLAVRRMCKAEMMVVATKASLKAVVSPNPSPQPSHCCSPDESAKHNSRSSCTTYSTVAAAVDISPQACDGDPRGEPENHGHGLDAGNGKLVGGLREARRREDEVGNGEQGPDGAEEHKIHGAGGPGVPRARGGINN